MRLSRLFLALRIHAPLGRWRPANAGGAISGLVLMAGVLAVTATPAWAQVRLKPPAAHEFNQFVERVEQALSGRAAGEASFLWLAEDRTRRAATQSGRIVLARLDSEASPDGAMIHNWIAGMFVPGVTLDDVLAVLLDYDRYPGVYPGVEASRLLGRDGDTRKLYQRLRRGDVVLDTWHDAGYRMLEGKRLVSWSRSTRIQEVSNAGGTDEQLLPPGQDQGYLWRMHLYWKLEQGDGGVYAECHSIALSRRVPFLLRWIVHPIIRGIASAGLAQSLAATRNEARKRAAESPLRDEIAN